MLEDEASRNGRTTDGRAAQAASDVIPARQSLRWKLPLALTILVGALVLTFMWIGHRIVENALSRGGVQRAHRAALQVSSMLDAEGGIAQLRLVAKDADLRRLLSHDDTAREAAHRRLAALALSGPRRIELWNAAGSRVLEVVVPAAPSTSAVPKELPAGEPPSKSGVSELMADGDTVFWDLVAEITDDGSGNGAAPPLGYLRVRSTFSVNPPGIISKLVGGDAVVKAGNASGGVWTDFSRVVDPPGEHANEEAGEYRAGDGMLRLGASMPVAGTPWLVWVGFPRAEIVAPAAAALHEMTIMAVLFLIVGAVLARMVAIRIARPITELNDAAAAIAAGEYSRRVVTGRRDEIGRLGHAFNAMASEVEAANERLETRVALRTAELAAARQEADRANQAKSAFLSAMSHDLRTPLNAILGFAQLLELDDPGSERTEPARQILNGGSYLLELINEVLDISRIESGQLSLSPEPVGVRDVVRRAVDLIEPLAVRRGIALSLESVSEKAVVKADRQRLGQVLINLLSNGIKYNRTDGRVMVRTRRMPGERLRISITDTGAGIPESKLALLFQPFERLGAEQTAVEGTGLGLVLSRALVEAMGGTIGVESVVDQGTTFWVELAESAHAFEREATERPAEPPVSPARSGTILYIEDNASNVRLMERILRQRPGVRLLDAPQGSTGIAMVRQGTIDLVLLDMHLPDMSGEEVLRQLWEDPDHRSIPIVVVTADATPGLARRLKAAGATACLTKPLNVKDVLQQFDTLLTAGPAAIGDA